MLLIERKDFSIDYLKTVLEKLKLLKRGGPSEHMGVCSQLRDKDSIINDPCYSFVNIFSKGWEYHSGDYAYCVPYPGDYFVESHGKNWRWEGEQKVLRSSLIDYLIQEVKNEIKERE